MIRLVLIGLVWVMLTAQSPRGDDNQPLLVPDVSSRNIEIRTSFSGSELLLFGAILYPDGDVPDEPADVAVVLRGPTEALLVREKEQVAGIWMNTDAARFASVPGFYAVESSAPLDTLLDERTAAIFELGLTNLQMSPGGGRLPERERRFEEGLVDLYARRGLYAEDDDGVEISQGVLYRARIPIPSRVPVGIYEAETFLISQGRVIAVATRDVEIGKIGFERFVTRSAERQPFFYGLAAIFISLFMGWAAAMILGRRT